MSYHSVYILIILFLLSIVQCDHIIPLPADSCPFHSADSSIPDIPQIPVNTQCLLSSTNSCCNAGYFDQYSTSDVFIPATQRFFSSITESCQNFIRDYVGCIPCQQDSGVWTQILTGTPNSYKVTFCAGFCDRFYTACKESVVASNSRQVQSAYQTKELFCSAVYQGQGSNIIANVAAPGDKNCFDEQSRLCTEDDIDFYYSPCVDGHRDLQYSWKYNVTCHGGHNLPPAQYNLFCPIYCEEGYYLPLGTHECQICSAGTFSLGGGIKIEQWDTFFQRYLTFNTYCLDKSNNRIQSVGGEPCTGWALNDTYIHSNISGLNNTKSVLEVEVQIRNINSSVSFLALVDSEYNYDKFIFNIDDQSVWIKNSLEPVVSTYPLSIGYHRLKWTYLKDSTLDQGTDSTTIWYIEITGLFDHSDYCSSCRAGTTSIYQGASTCTECGLNQYNSQPGTPTCYDCPANQYSYPGDSKCTDRLECTEKDWEVFYTECVGFTRTKYYNWIQPQICLNTTLNLPVSEPNQPCENCHAGQYRDESDCHFCPAGQYTSAPGTQTTCQQCGAGYYTPKQLNLNAWNDWPNNTINNCLGECGATAWRLRSDFIDSGTSHGSRASVTLILPIIIETWPYGTVEYNFSLTCDGWCYLELFDGISWMKTNWNDFDAPGQLVSIGPLNLFPGPHNLTWMFSKYSPGRNNDHAKIFSILIEGVPFGGSRECIQCSAGTYSETPTDSCKECPAGNFAPAGSTECLPCEENFYQDYPGSGACKPCPPGTYSPPGGTSCGNNNCQYSPDNNVTLYDVSPLLLNKPVGMYGPITESVTSYYISLCDKRNEIDVNRTLLDENGKAVLAYAVAIDTQSGVAKDLGHLLGFYPYPGPEQGFSFLYTEGTPCGDEKPLPRIFNLTMICDQKLGVGSPESGNPSFSMGNESCTHYVTWRSIFGCPVCTSSDYIAITEICQKNTQTIQYIWKPDRKCHGGVLPPPFTQNCTSYATCSIGSYETIDGLCEQCPMDSYSPGPAEFYDSVFFSSPTVVNIVPFTTTCTGSPCSVWTSGKGYIESGANGNSTVTLPKEFNAGVVTAVEFDYTLYGEGLGFGFYIDGVEVTLRSGTLRYSVSPGIHTLEWRYQHKPSVFNSQRDNYVRVRNIKLLGTVTSIPACIPCPEGTVSDSDRGYCHECPVDSYANMTERGYKECISCPQGTFRLEGQPSCIAKPECTVSDFIIIYPYVDNEPCNTTFKYKAKTPQICQGETPEGESRSDCSCPSHKLLEDKTCKDCPSGQYYNMGACQPATKGYTTVPLITYFPIKPFKVSVVSSDFHTKLCNSIECKDGVGWRLEGTFADSGLYFTEVSSILEFTVETDPNFFIPAKIAFTVSYEAVSLFGTVDSSKNGLEFLIDNQPQDFPFTFKESTPTQKTFVIPKGTHTLRWVYSQQAGSPGIVTLSDIIVTGSKKGSRAQQLVCPSGSTDNGENLCVACNPGYYSPLPGASSCLPCPEGTVSLSNSEKCEVCGLGTRSEKNTCKSNCQFSINATYVATYDLTPLKQSILTVIPNNEEDTQNVFQVNLCDKFSSVYCSSIECSENSFIFAQFNDQQPVTLGTWLEFRPLPTVDSDHTFDLTYSRGKNIPTGCSSINTTIQFYCAVHEGKGFPQVKSYEQHCNIVFEWKTLYACPLCTETDKIDMVGPCKNGKRTKYTTYRNPCNGPASYPIEEDCEDLELEKSTVLLGVLIGALLLITGIGCACYFFQQKRNIEAKYELLRNEVQEEEQVL